jgi:[lysine-biosynthesis-protein LysW]---L-2-aminoadipate ligase
MASSRVTVLGSAKNETNRRLVTAWRARGIECALVDPPKARQCDCDVFLARLDVLPTLAGVEPGLLELLWLERSGAAVRNRVASLLATHDKLRTAAALKRAGLPHPLTRHLPAEASRLPQAPVVLKPRFGSWGRDVHLCRTDSEVVQVMTELRSRAWFHRHGVLAQSVVPTPGFDLRLVVAGGRVVGAIERHPRPGEWRTNVSVGAIRRPTTPDPDAYAVALAAAQAVGADLVGVDLLPLPTGGYTVIELNGAADFTQTYSLAGDIYAEAADALGFTEKRRRYNGRPWQRLSAPGNSARRSTTSGMCVQRQRTSNPLSTS